MEQLPNFSKEPEIVEGDKEQEDEEDNYDEEDDSEQETKKESDEGILDIINKTEKYKQLGNRILLVDDEPMCLMGLKLLLEVCKIDNDLVDLAHNGAQAL